MGKWHFIKYEMCTTREWWKTGYAYVDGVLWASCTTSGGSSTVQHSSAITRKLLERKKKNIYSRTAWATNDPLYKRIKCKASAKCFKNFRIVKLWYFDIRIVFSIKTIFNRNRKLPPLTSLFLLTIWRKRPIQVLF